MLLMSLKMTNKKYNIQSIRKRPKHSLTYYSNSVFKQYERSSKNHFTALSYRTLIRKLYLISVLHSKTPNKAQCDNHLYIWSVGKPLVDQCY